MSLLDDHVRDHKVRGRGKQNIIGLVRSSAVLPVQFGTAKVLLPFRQTIFPYNHIDISI